MVQHNISIEYSNNSYPYFFLGSNKVEGSVDPSIFTVKSELSLTGKESVAHKCGAAI